MEGGEVEGWRVKRRRDKEVNRGVERWKGGGVEG